MPRKPQRGYFVRGEFVVRGSPRDLELKSTSAHAPSRATLKRQSAQLQQLGEALLSLSAPQLDRLNLDEALRDALAQAQRISDFEGKRRQMQYIGKQMRSVEPALLEAMRAALAEQQRPSAQENKLLRLSEAWRDQLIAHDAQLKRWLSHFPHSDGQHLRTLIRQARQEKVAPEKPGTATRQGRAYRDIFQRVREQLSQHPNPPPAA